MRMYLQRVIVLAIPISANLLAMALVAADVAIIIVVSVWTMNDSNAQQDRTLQLQIR